MTIVRVTRLPSHRLRGQGGFTLIELLTVVVILGVLAVVAIGAYSKQIRAAHKSEVISDLSNLTLRQKTFQGVSGHFASSTDCEGDTCVYPLMATVLATKGPVEWAVIDDGYTAAAASDGPWYRGGPALHGFDVLRFMPEGADSWCGYATISGWGTQASDQTAADEPANTTLAQQIFPAGTEAHFARDWFYSYALCDFDFDSTYWAFTTAHYGSEVISTTDATGTYVENE
jgi:prepilin-type N-terminal cleavage/methylation domain-containing protein